MGWSHVIPYLDLELVNQILLVPNSSDLKTSGVDEIYECSFLMNIRETSKETQAEAGSLTTLLIRR